MLKAIGCGLSFALLPFLALWAPVTNSGGANTPKYSEQLNIVETSDGPSVLGMFDKFGAGRPSGTTCSQSVQQRGNPDALRDTLQSTVPPPTDTCSTQKPHCYPGSEKLSDCSSNAEPYMIDCVPTYGCVSYICHDSTAKGCCNTCTRTDQCPECKNTGYCTTS